MNFNRHDINKNAYMLTGKLARQGYDWWWHNFTGYNLETGEEKTFYIEYFVINPALATNEPTFDTPSYLMIKAGAWGRDACQIHNFYPLKDTAITKTAPYRVLVYNDNSELIAQADDTHITGSVSVTKQQILTHPEWMSDVGQMKWDLKIDKQVAFNVGYGTSLPLRKAHAYQMYWHVEGMKSAYNGYVEYNGVKYMVNPETSYGYADKNWGNDYTSPWIWLSSNDIISKITGNKLMNSVFDIGGGCPQVGALKIPNQLVSAFWYEGVPYEFNFSKFWKPTSTKFNCYEEDSQIVWNIYQKNRDEALEVHATCPKNEMLKVKYQSPNGAIRHNRLWNGGTGVAEIKLYHYEHGKKLLVDEMLAKHVGCEYGEY